MNPEIGNFIVDWQLQNQVSKFNTNTNGVDEENEEIPITSIPGLG